MIMEQLQNKDERIEALKTQNATILAELADQKKTNNEIIDKMKYISDEIARRSFPTDSDGSRLPEIPTDSGVTVPKKKGSLVGLARRASSCPSSSQTPYTDPMIMEQLQNKDERIEALETQNATILAELADQKKINNEIIEKMKCLFPNEF
ncbi:hypothetical protein F2Q70_00010185 [Brassica cretica]|uniref:Uncharacterized protein n=1 Tax=Brassica cretica TaxID=69181 RepID=A0A8S9M4W3_BRACR|nr:hypothetical protein F2Q70_00010185 [Brassica cretica]